ncbi:MAG: hypothetical protein K8J31_23815 [Anaerolineae bacterium]|jgi:hypothetical protein|nr:hypothetical protein [Anaerolineae bacterium]
MGVSWSWDNQDRSIIRFTFASPWMLGEFIAANQEAIEITDHFNHIVDAIFDFRKGTMIPSGAISVFRNTARRALASPNEGITVLLGASAFVQMIYNGMTQLSPDLARTIQQAEDDCEAYRLIAVEHALRETARSGVRKSPEPLHSTLYASSQSHPLGADLP